MQVLMASPCDSENAFNGHRRWQAHFDLTNVYPVKPCILLPAQGLQALSLQ
ncbi:hypothetical protein [Burkholderia cenocepacia]|uniref:hypothetical protein n=1 Tax=Burkholderia cenocepacia TaxID=95486 RepID=UPI0015C52BF6|nr:hypothetical protein [Burkholderia cenocepacia]